MYFFSFPFFLLTHMCKTKSTFVNAIVPKINSHLTINISYKKELMLILQIFIYTICITYYAQGHRYYKVKTCIGVRILTCIGVSILKHVKTTWAYNFIYNKYFLCEHTISFTNSISFVSQLVGEYNFISMDTEFPDIVHSPIVRRRPKPYEQHNYLKPTLMLLTLFILVSLYLMPNNNLSHAENNRYIRNSISVTLMWIRTTTTKIRLICSTVRVLTSFVTPFTMWILFHFVMLM